MTLPRSAAPDAPAGLLFDRSVMPSAVVRIAEVLRERGHRAWIVGGCVRDVLMGRPAKDWDLATTARPDEVQQAFRRVVPTGIQHGTVTVILGGVGYEVTTLRGEGAYSDGRRPDTVHFVGTIEEDLARRDFTVNAIAFDPLEGVLVDPWGGVADLQRRVIRAVGHAADRFGEDGLRALRAARFVSTLEMDLDAATEAAIPGALATFAKVSAERVRDEWEKACRAPRASRAFAVMRRTGMLALTAPPTVALDDRAMQLALARMDEVEPSLAMRVGALIWDLPWSGPELERWLRGLRFSNEDRAVVVSLHAHRAVSLDAGMPAPERRRMLARVGVEPVRRLLALASADARARGVDDPTPPMQALVEADVAAAVPLSTQALAVSGNDLMKELGLTQGRELGVLLKSLLEAVLDDPTLNERGRLLAHAAALRSERLG